MKFVAPILTAAAIAAVSSFGLAQAASPQTGNLQVKITITKDCQVNAGNGTAGTAGDSILDFGSHGVLNANIDEKTASTGAGSIQVQCTNGTAYTIALNAGTNPSAAGDVNTRRMKNGTEFVGYQLYSDSGRTTVWGNTVGTDTVAKTADGTVQTFPVFGRVPPQTTPSAGAYQDAVVISVSF